MFDIISEYKILIIVLGGLFLFIGISFFIYSKNINNNNLSFRATVIGFRKMTSKTYDNTSCPTVEFDFNGSMIKSYYYRYMFDEEINFEIGNTITIFVNPKMPKTFRFENDKMSFKFKDCIIVSTIGLICLIIGIIM